MTDELTFVDDVNDADMQTAIRELETLIRSHYPSASFTIGFGDDPEGVYLRATVDVDDLDEVVDVYVDRLIDLNLEHRLALHVIPVWPPARVYAELQDRQAARTRALAGST